MHFVQRRWLVDSLPLERDDVGLVTVEPARKARVRFPPFPPTLIYALSLKAASARSGRPGAGQRSRRCAVFATGRCRTETKSLAPLSDRAARRRISRP